MSNLQLIEKLCNLLSEAAEIIREQDALLRQHGILSDGASKIEQGRANLLAEIENTI